MNLTDLEDVIQLPVSERIRLVSAIWDSTAQTPDAVELTEEQKIELDCRLQALENNPYEGSSWTEVQARVWQGK